MTELQKLVIEQFGSASAQEFYALRSEAGLWPSEKILIERYFPRSARVLDLGCGTGRTTIPLHAMGYNVTGVDITPAMIENAKKAAASKGLHIDYEVGDARQLRFADASFACCLFSNQGWTQIPGSANRLRALREVLRILRPGGVFIFTTHVRNLWGKYALLSLTLRYATLWPWRWMKFFLLRPLGLPIDEQEFGDRFFCSEGKLHYPHKQYIHIPRVEEVQAQIVEAGFELTQMRRTHEIVKDDQLPSSPMFYVCRKPVR